MKWRGVMIDKRERRLNDPEYMKRLRKRFFLCSWTTNEEALDLAGESWAAALIDVSLAAERLRKEICRRLRWRK